MLSIEQCKKYIKKQPYNEKNVEILRDSLYHLANVLIDGYILNKEKNKQKDVIN